MKYKKENIICLLFIYLFTATSLDKPLGLFLMYPAGGVVSPHEQKAPTVQITLT